MNERDRLLIVMLARGYTTTRIAREMRLSRYTVAERISKLLDRFACSNRSQLVAYGYAHEFLHVGTWPPCAAAPLGAESGATWSRSS
ncbi:LuxR C-terminal-related transcriptional regulator [Spongiactinospora sp. TRM90649]|uniref:LuxR C-terminal-related transcriptional regulator n=1 Tax=Spongiactinospora sp. TRM90649 TaxID=3031114 RepID=UPI0023F72CFC|nr:LuxR C-terminal-related transcriptional regulator [Spongiactinospora sp. TRM90649]MDF5759113.1 LuxR C-terminal-related transcriptional regulator [Spongiactinospora sp. TRM90649]